MLLRSISCTAAAWTKSEETPLAPSLRLVLQNDERQPELHQALALKRLGFTLKFVRSKHFPAMRGSLKAPAFYFDLFLKTQQIMTLLFLGCLGVAAPVLERDADREGRGAGPARSQDWNHSVSSPETGPGLVSHILVKHAKWLRKRKLLNLEWRLIVHFIKRAIQAKWPSHK